jgi:hypothetical protein
MLRTQVHNLCSRKNIYHEVEKSYLPLADVFAAVI